MKLNFVKTIGLEIHKIDKSWNSFDKINEKLKLVHCTNLAKQHWKRVDHPHEYEWFKMAQDAFQGEILKQEDIDMQ